MRFLSFFEESVISRNVERLRVPFTEDGFLHVLELLMAIKNEGYTYIKNEYLNKTKVWFENLRQQGKIQLRVCSGEDPIFLVELADSVEFIEKIPNIPLDVRNRFIELVKRVLGGDKSLISDVDIPCLAMLGEKRRNESESLERRSKAHEMELSLITKAGAGLKEILGGPLDDETQRELKRRCFACIDRFSSSI